MSANSDTTPATAIDAIALEQAISCIGGPILADEQIEEVEREIRHRMRLYPEWVSKGRYKLDTAARKIAVMRRVRDTLAWLADNRAWIDAEHKRRVARARLEAEAETLRDDPAVETLLDAFPEAEITHVRHIETREDA